MRTTGHNANAASTPKTGLFAMLGGLLRIEGIGASSVGVVDQISSARRALVLAFTLVLASLAFAVAPALAAVPPETPEVTVESITATGATFNDVLNPAAAFPVEAGTYQYLYRKTKTAGCEGESTAPVAPAMGMYTGSEPFPAPEPVSGLAPDAYYTVCLRAETTGKDAATSTPVVFESAPEAPSMPVVGSVTETTAMLHGVLNPDNAGEAGTYEFLYGEAASGCTTAVAPPQAATGVRGQEAEVELTGLAPGGRYVACLAMSNAAGEMTVGPAVTFITPAEPPEIAPESTSSTEVTSTSATLGAEINPGGGPTTYHFEYIDQAGYEAALAESAPDPYSKGASTPESVSIGSDLADHPASAQVAGLEAGKVYHYRVVASNASTQGVPGPDATFTTQAAGQEFSMLDNRAWEQVTPQEKNGATIQPISYKGGVVQAAADGEAMTYSASGPIGEASEANDAPSGSQILSTRGAKEGGWTSKDIAAPIALGVVPEGTGFEYKDFSSNLEDAILEPEGATLLPAPTKNTPQEQTLYLRQSTGGLTNPLVNEVNIKEGARLGDLASTAGRIKFEYATPDLHHVLFESPEDLGRNEPPGIEPAGTYGGTNADVYEWSGEPGQLGTVQLVSLLPGGEKSGAGVVVPGTEWPDVKGVARDALSTDGSRVAWTAGSDSLYLTDTTKRESVVVALRNPAKGEPAFQGANAEGTRIFFTDTGALTPGADRTQENEEGDLYVYEAPRSGGPLAGTLQDLTADAREVNGKREEGNVLSRMIGYGAQGAGPGEALTLYFVDSGVLDENEGAAGRTASSGAPNLYVEHLIAGTWQPPQFIATLSLADGRTWGAETRTNELDEQSLFPEMTAGVSPSGRYLSFMSAEPLTGYDNRDVVSGVRDEEVFVFDSQTGKLACASCDPSGARPHGILDFGYGMLADEQHSWRGHWLAASLPGWTPNLEAHTSTYQSRFMSSTGRTFFDSADGLVPGDVNGKEDVYEYEPEGVGSCTSTLHNQGAVYSPAAGGCVGLVSSGTSSVESAFLDASAGRPGGEEGEDVFFLTSSPLTAADHDSAIDVYDAHQCSALSPCPATAAVTPPPCGETAACHGRASGEGLGSLASEGVLGQSNAPAAIAVKSVVLTRAQKLAKALKVCRRDRVKRRRVSCEKAARRSYGPVARKKSRGKQSASGRGR